MSKQSGTRKGQKFIGAYIPKGVKAQLEAMARAEDRPLSWVIEKILERGVKHLTQGPELKKAA